MCLNIDPERKPPTKPFKAYKVLNYLDGKVFTPTKKTLVNEGKFIAKGRITEEDLKEGEIKGGAIHLYEDKESAEDDCYTNYHFIMEITVFPEDFLYWGKGNQLCVKKLIFPKGCFIHVSYILQIGLLRRGMKKLQDQLNGMQNHLKVTVGKAAYQDQVQFQFQLTK